MLPVVGQAGELVMPAEVPYMRPVRRPGPPVAAEAGSRRHACRKSVE